MLRALVATGACAACATVELPRDATVVRDLDIKGEQAVSEGELRERILTNELTWWPFDQPRPFDQSDWQMDLRRIQRFYETRGYYQARILSTRIIPIPRATGTQKAIDLEVEIEENDPVRVGAVAFGGFEGLLAAEREALEQPLEKEWSLKTGAIFREDDWTAAKRQVERHLRQLGHATAEVDGNALVDVSRLTANLDLHVNAGPRYFFGPIEVRAPGTRVPTAWVEEQVKLAIPPGAPFSDEALAEAQRRVFAMNVFSTARVTTGQPDAVARVLPVVAEVREGPIYTLRGGGGVGVDQIRQEARLIGEWTNRDFLGGLRRLALRAQAGWAFIPSVLDVAQSDDAERARHGPLYRAGADFDQPRLFGRPSLRGKALLESERELEQTYDSIGGRGLVGMSWAPRSWLTVFPSYNFQGNWLTGPVSAPSQAAPLALGCRADPCFVTVSYLEQVVTADTRDNALEPRKGYYLGISLQEGGGPLGGDFDYLRVLPEARVYFTTLRERFTLASRLRLGTLITRSGRPEESAVTTRFYSGGSLGMRGFATRRLSPLLLVPVPNGSDLDRTTVPIGGNGLVEGSIEARGRFTDNLVLAAFADFGAITRARLPPLAQLPDFLWALGFGFRYLTPVGPVRLDLAFRLPVGRPPPLLNEQGVEITYEKVYPGNEQSEDGSHVAGGCFGIGGNVRSWVRDSNCAFHISIGEAF